uniref:Proteasome 26S subunit, ATPase 1 n=1 Tax=Ovis aries TaxID=9940 RepID=A0AC11E047_SHEEP
MLCLNFFFQGQSQSGGHGPGGGKKDDKDKKKKYEPPVPTRVGKKKKKTKGPDAASKLPLVTPHTQCRLKLLKLERIKDYLLMEEEFIRNQEQMKPLEEKQEEERSKVDDLRGTPMSVGTLEEIIDDNHAIVSTSVGSEHYVSILSFVDKDLLEPGCSVLLNHKVHAVIGVLMDDTDPLVTVMKVEKAPQETYADIGGLDNQIQEIKESVELPLTHPEYYEEMGIKPPKGVILYGPPGTGKTLLAKAVANQTSATFLRVVGSELIQKYLGDGPKLVRELFRVAEEHAPSIVFIDEIDAIGTKSCAVSSGSELTTLWTLGTAVKTGLCPRGAHMWRLNKNDTVSGMKMATRKMLWEVAWALGGWDAQVGQPCPECLHQPGRGVLTSPWLLLQVRLQLRRGERDPANDAGAAEPAGRV